MTDMIVNFGCGSTAPPGFVNVDGSPTVLLARLPLPAKFYGSKAKFVAALRRGRVKYATARHLRFRDGSVDGFYASRVLNNLGRDECYELLRRVRTWLKPTGLLRVVVPDLRSYISRYSGGEIDANRFVELTRLSVDSMKWWQLFFGHSRHRWLYDSESADKLLRSAGYTNIRHCHCGESGLREFAHLDELINAEDELMYLEASR